MRLVTSRPVISGIATSRIARSGWRSRASWRASTPLRAEITVYPERSRRTRTSVRMSTSSSAMSTRRGVTSMSQGSARFRPGPSAVRRTLCHPDPARFTSKRGGRERRDCGFERLDGERLLEQRDDAVSGNSVPSGIWPMQTIGSSGKNSRASWACSMHQGASGSRSRRSPRGGTSTCRSSVHRLVPEALHQHDEEATDVGVRLADQDARHCHKRTVRRQRRKSGCASV